MWDRSANRKQVIPKLVSHINNIGQHYGGVIIMAIKDYAEIIQSMREDNKSYGDIAKAIGYHRDSVKKWCRDNGLGGLRAGKSLEEREEEYIKRFTKKHPNFEYVSGYEGCNSTIKVKCKMCGHTQERHANSKDCMQCDNCIKIERKKRLEQLNEEKQNRVRKENEYTETECVQCGKVFLRRGNHQKYCSEDCFNKAYGIGQTIIKQCIECGEKFKTLHDGNIYCSDKCRKRKYYRVHRISKDKRLRRNGKVDYSITLSKLIKRDKNICHICGEECNGEDYTITEEGYFIAGERYPSIDHVIPIAKGGLHRWDNVKLAHMYCNTIKRDKTIYEENNMQLRIF